MVLLEHGATVTLIDNLSNSFPRVFDHMTKLAGDKASRMKYIKVIYSQIHLITRGASQYIQLQQHTQTTTTTMALHLIQGSLPFACQFGTCCTTDAFWGKLALEFKSQNMRNWVTDISATSSDPACAFPASPLFHCSVTFVTRMASPSCLPLRSECSTSPDFLLLMNFVCV